MDLQNILESAKEIALEAGKMVRSKLDSGHEIKSKGKFDFVTDVDKASEKLISSYVKRKFPEHLIFGEEAVSSSEEDEDSLIDRIPDDKYVWVVDPIDGTTNFIRGMHQYAISIGIVKNKQVVAGVVYDISMDELFYTMQGSPSYCNGNVIHVSENKRFEDSIAVTSFPVENLEARQILLKTLMEKGNSLLSLRIWNCAAIAAVSLACGRTDVYVEPGIHLWDFSAGKLLIENAGGKFFDFAGKDFNMHQRNVIAANPYLADEVVIIVMNAVNSSGKVC